MVSQAGCKCALFTFAYKMQCFVYSERKSWFLKSPLKNAFSLSPTQNAIIFPSSFLDSKYTDSQGEIEFLHCYATLKTKSQTKFYIEFHSSCLESMILLIFILSVQVSCLFGLVPLSLALIWINSCVDHLFQCKKKGCPRFVVVYKSSYAVSNTIQNPQPFSCNPCSGTWPSTVSSILLGNLIISFLKRNVCCSWLSHRKSLLGKHLIDEISNCASYKQSGAFKIKHLHYANKNNLITWFEKN